MKVLVDEESLMVGEVKTPIVIKARLGIKMHGSWS